MQAQDKERDKETAEKDFLNELKFQYEKEFELRNILDSKATNLITICSSIITISIAIATFLISKIQSTYLVIIALIILGFGIFFATKAIRSFLKSYSLKTYGFAMGHERFFDDIGRYQKDIANQFMNSSKRSFAEHMAKEYLESIRKNMKNNKDKADNIKNGQKYLSWSVLTISILAVVVVVTKLAK
jgi:hypothetical protein